MSVIIKNKNDYNSFERKVFNSIDKGDCFCDINGDLCLKTGLSSFFNFDENKRYDYNDDCFKPYFDRRDDELLMVDVEILWEVKKK